jgi:Ca2+-binding RTX toxin-like protein
LSRILGVVLAVAAALAGCLVADARAATADATNGTLFYGAAAGESNDVAVTLVFRSATNDYAVTVADAGATIGPGGACTAVTPSEVTCEPVTRLEFTLRGGADSLTVLGAGRNTAGECLLTAYGGPGNDQLAGTSHADCLFGGRGDDRLEGHAGERLYSFEPTEQLEGGPGDDVLLGGVGSDLLVGGWGADVLRGGRGTADLVSYLPRHGGVHADLDGARDDGALGEQDLVGRDVEDLLGGEGADVLLGNARANTITGASRGDLIRGYGGLDHLEGGLGPDIIAGGDGGDWLFAGFDNNGHYVADGPTPNLLRGGAGRDILFSSGNGPDRLVDGGTGIDIAGVDQGVDPVRRVERFAARAR